jgi:anti-sigma factor RsiW
MPSQEDGMMTCAEMESLLCDYVDGTLDAEHQALLKKHLDACSACAAQALDAAGAVAFMARVPAIEPPDELVTRLLWLHASNQPAASKPSGLRAFFVRWMQPVLQPRFAMGMAMTVLSFGLLGSFAGIQNRQLRADDLRPAKVLAAVEDRFQRIWDGLVRYYDNLRVVYEIQNRLSEWTASEEPASPSEGEQMSLPDQPEGPSGVGERKEQQ